MGWCGATEIMDAAVEGALRSITHAWQIASGNEDARTPAYANALRDRPRLQETLDETLRPFVAQIATVLRQGDWDCIEESDYFERFRQEMLGLDHEEMTRWYRDRLYEADDTEEIAKWAHLLQEHAARQSQETTSDDR